MLSDPLNLLYFHFATAVVCEFEKVNAMFQTNRPDPSDLLRELDLHHRSLRGRIFHRDGTPKRLDEVDFGEKFRSECVKYINSGTTRDEVDMRS